MRKMLLPLLLCAALMMSLAACGSNTPAAGHVPSDAPTAPAEQQPSEQPSEVPSEQPGEKPTPAPSEEQPGEVPGEEPSEAPAEVPSEEPVEVPSEEPSAQPSEAPSGEPAPSAEPTPTPSAEPTPSPKPTPTPSVQPEPPAALLEGCWDGVGVNADKDWYPENPLDGMPNTAKLVEQYDLGYKGEITALAVNGVNLRTNYGPDTLVLEGFSYSSNDQDRYETAIALLKDVLDAESATALINWIEELNGLNNGMRDARIAHGRDSAEFAAADAAMDAHGNELWEAKFPVKFGNVYVEWYESGQVIGFAISNK